MKFIKTTLNNTPLHFIKTSQFKSVHLSLRFFADLDEKTATIRHLMVSMLRAKNERFSNRSELSKHLESLYDTVFIVNSHKLGTQHINQLSLRFVNPSYTANDDYLDDVLEFLRVTLHAPAFDEKTLKEEKQFLKDYFAAEYSNKSRYAAKRYIEHLYHDHPYRVHPYGKPEAIDAITLNDIKQAYAAMLKEDACLISLSGDFDETRLKEKLIKAIDVGVAPLKQDIFIQRDFETRSPIRETLDVSQDRLFMTFKTGVYHGDAAYYPLTVLNALYGETGEAKLFANIREKASLAYYIQSVYSPFSGLITVASGMDKTNIDQAQTMILEQLDAIKDGDITDDELKIAKNHLITTIKQSYDSLGNLAVKGLRHALFDVPFDEKAQLRAIEAVSKADVVAVAARIEPIFTYVLTGGKTDENHSL